MIASDPYTPGTVDWTGENPGMYLKTGTTGPWTSLMSLFRVTWSPHGIGHALVLLEDPAGTNPHANNLCLTDNEPLARYCIDGFMRHFAAFRDRPLLQTLPYKPLDSVRRAANTPTEYAEHVSGAGLDIVLTWGRLGTPYAVDMAPDLTATGQHRMYSLFVDSDEAWCTVNGRRLPGQVVPRPVAGRDSRSAFLAFSETWVRQ